MGKVQSILFDCLFVNQKNTETMLTSFAVSFWRYLVVRINSFLLLPFGVKWSHERFQLAVSCSNCSFCKISTSATTM